MKSTDHQDDYSRTKDKMMREFSYEISALQEILTKHPDPHDERFWEQIELNLKIDRKVLLSVKNSFLNLHLNIEGIRNQIIEALNDTTVTVDTDNIDLPDWATSKIGEMSIKYQLCDYEKRAMRDIINKFKKNKKALEQITTLLLTGTHSKTQDRWVAFARCKIEKLG